MQMSNRKQKSGDRREMAIHELVPTSQQQTQLRSAFCHVVGSLLINYLDGLSGNTEQVKRIRKKLAAKKPPIRRMGLVSKSPDPFLGIQGSNQSVRVRMDIDTHERRGTRQYRLYLLDKRIDQDRMLTTRRGNLISAMKSEY